MRIMKIMAMSDIHADFETFDKALEVVKASDAEVLAIAGDLSGKLFNEEEKKAFLESKNIIDSIGQQLNQATKGQVRNIHDAAELLKNPNVKINYSSNNGEKPIDFRKAAEDYLAVEGLAREKMLKTYVEFGKRFKELEGLGKKVLLVPGDWDGKCIEDVLSRYSLHDKYPEEVNGVTFAGYGGSPMFPKEIPAPLIVPFSSHEAFVHLSKQEDADVVITHEAPAEFEGENSRIRGEYCLTSVLFRNTPGLWISGHTHAPYKQRIQTTPTLVVNPGNLGRYENTAYGAFLEIELGEDKTAVPSKLWNFSGSYKNVRDDFLREEEKRLEAQ